MQLLRLQGRPPCLLEMYGKSRSATYGDIANGLLTPPVKIGLRASAWPLHEIETVIKARVAGKNDDEIREIVTKLVAARKTAA